jgi:hypothetical protein
MTYVSAFLTVYFGVGNDTDLPGVTYHLARADSEWVRRGAQKIINKAAV